MLHSNAGKFLIGGLVLLVIFVFGAIGWSIANPPKKEKAYSEDALKAKKVEPLGRDHLNDVSGVKYNSFPPTSGTHFPLWAKRGVYTYPMSDGYLIHSLEHGYVLLSYNCGEKGKDTFEVLKKDAPLTKMHGDEKDPAMRPLTPDSLPEKEVELPDAFSNVACQALVKDLSQFLDTYQRVIIMPRPSLDATIALTAWGQIDKMDSFDRSRILAFIDTFHNKGPEQTVE